MADKTTTEEELQRCEKDPKAYVAELEQWVAELKQQDSSNAQLAKAADSFLNALRTVYGGGEKVLEVTGNRDLVKKLDKALNFIEQGAGFLSMAAVLLPPDKAQIANAALEAIKQLVRQARPLVPRAMKLAGDAVRACLRALFELRVALLTVFKMLMECKQTMSLQTQQTTTTTTATPTLVAEQTLVSEVVTTTAT